MTEKVSRLEGLTYGGSMGTPEGRSITPEQLATRELGVQNREFTYAASRHGSRISEVEERKPRRRGVVRKTGDWLAWGFVATIGQAAKNVVETTLEAGVYAGTIYGAIFLAKLAAFAPAVAFLGSFFVSGLSPHKASFIPMPKLIGLP